MTQTAMSGATFLAPDRSVRRQPAAEPLAMYMPLAVCVYTRSRPPLSMDSSSISSESHVLALYKPDVSKISAQSAATAKSANSCRKYKEMPTPKLSNSSSIVEEQSG